MKTPKLFIDIYKGKTIDYDGVYGSQCVDAYKVFCKWIKITPYATGNNYACGYWYGREAVKDIFNFIYSPTELKKGDWCIWDFGSSCSSSHIAMFVDYAEDGYGYFFGQNQKQDFKGFCTVKIKLDILGALRWKNWDKEEKKEYMNGIDISNWQYDLNLNNIDYDFVIAKSTEGIGWVDSTCDRFIQQAIAQNKKWGFYHFARPENDPIAEAMFWYENTKNYFGKGLPVLDVEIQNPNIVSWCYKFLSKIIDLTGVKPIVYMSEQSMEWRYDWSAVVSLDCGLWLAAYRTEEVINGYNISNTWNIPTPRSWKFICMWQYTSNGRLAGYNKRLDLDIFYGDASIWDKYCMPLLAEPVTEPIETPQEPTQKPVDDKPIEEKPSQNVPIEPVKPNDSIFNMPNWLYDLLKFIASILLPLLTTLYVALADTWKWQFTKEVVASVTAFITFLNGLLAYSSIEYTKKRGGK